MCRMCLQETYFPRCSWVECCWWTLQYTVDTPNYPGNIVKYVQWCIYSLCHAQHTYWAQIGVLSKSQERITSNILPNKNLSQRTVRATQIEALIHMVLPLLWRLRWYGEPTKIVIISAEHQGSTAAIREHISEHARVVSICGIRLHIQTVVWDPCLSCRGILSE